MNRYRRGFMDDVEYPLGTHIKTKRVTGGGSGRGDRATETGRDRPVDMARKHTNHLRMLLEEIGQLRSSSHQSFRVGTRHAAVKWRMM